MVWKNFRLWAEAPVATNAALPTALGPLQHATWHGNAWHQAHPSQIEWGLQIWIVLDIKIYQNDEPICLQVMPVSEFHQTFPDLSKSQ